ncbi:MAG: hypothetical protein LAO22_06785 [Acidobacteriia bacterium]|nr:hypothetical protein [Terriglobia bacterium]
MSKRVVVTAAFIVALTAFGGSGRVAAQETTSAAKASTAAVEPAHAYRVDFSVNEVEDNKKINTRQYSLNLKSGDANEIKIGTRVPISGQGATLQYIDVGTNIWCRIKDRADETWLGNDVSLSVRSDISNFARPNQEGGVARDNEPPVLRQLKIDASTVAVLGKPMVIGSVDDPNSKRQFQLEVTVTKLR